jgi:branched-chain amino acid transport system substrate-binding protein
MAMAALALAACGGASNATPAASNNSAPFNVLVVDGVSGASGATNTACVNGMQAASLVINQEGGILGHKVAMHTYDDASSPTSAVSLLAQQLGSSTTWNYAFGGGNSDEALAMAPTLNKAKLINLTSTSGSQFGNPATNPYQFINGVTVDTVNKILIDEFNKRGFKKPAVLYEDNAYGQSESASMVKWLKASGSNPIVIPFAATAVDVSPTLLQLQAQGVDGVVWSAIGASVGYVAKSRAKIGWNVPFLGDLGVGSTDILTISGGKDNVPNMSYLQWTIDHYNDPAQQTAAFKRFFEALKSVVLTLNLALHSYGVCYDQLMALRAGVQQASSLESDKIKAALESLKVPKPSPFITAPDGWGWTKDSHNPVNAPSQFQVGKVGQLVDGQVHDI